MNHEVTPSIVPGNEQLRQLRTALAICQGIKLLPTLQHETEGTISHDQTKRITYLTGLFSRIHREMFHHWKEQATVSHRPGAMPDAAKRKDLRKTIGRLVLDDEKNSDTALFDNNGFVIRTDNIAERLADFYHKMRRVRPFAYGNRITLDFFLTALGRLPAFKAVYEQGIDFRRLEAQDTVVLHDPESPLEAVITAFRHALDPSRNRSLQNKPNGYGKWPENKKFVSGIPFLSHRTEDGTLCLVAVNGGLVPLNSVREDLFEAGKHLADFPLSASEHIIGYLPGTEELRVPGKNFIDSIAVEELGPAPLFCLDVNMLTGLRSQSHTELVELLRQCEGENASIAGLADNEPLKRRLLLAADGDRRLERSVEIAYEHLGRIMAIIERAKDEIFRGKTPTEHPRLFMCMGGAGSGKTAVEELAKAQCGDNFVIASLDEFRKKSDLYKVLTAANHHSDDYVYVEPFANRLRDLVAEQARNQGINILYDGTGIPYSPRYSGIVGQFKQAGFHTQIVAVDAFIVKPKGREEELVRSTVIGSVKDRYEKTGRALPWVVTVYKHIRAPESFFYALEDPSLDKIALFANDGERDRHYLVAESFPFTDQEVRALQSHQRGGTLAEHWRELIRSRDDSMLAELARHRLADIDAWTARNPSFNESNVAYQAYPSNVGNRVLAIYNTGRMVDFVEKRQLNPNASGEEGLLHKKEGLAFDVDPLTREPWIIRLQGSLAR